MDTREIALDMHRKWQGKIGSAVLGLGDIGPEAARPVMEG